ncbi:unnamed protein product [Absidia cylindrospora]
MASMIAVQVVDSTLTFYLFTLESAGLYVMFELGRMDAPLTYEQLTQFTMKLDFLKKISTTTEPTVSKGRRLIQLLAGSDPPWKMAT